MGGTFTGLYRPSSRATRRLARPCPRSKQCCPSSATGQLPTRDATQYDPRDRRPCSCEVRRPPVPKEARLPLPHVRALVSRGRVKPSSRSSRTGSASTRAILDHDDQVDIARSSAIRALPWPGCRTPPRPQGRASQPRKVEHSLDGSSCVVGIAVGDRHAGRLPPRCPAGILSQIFARR